MASEREMEVLASSVSAAALEELKAIAEMVLALKKPSFLMNHYRKDGPTSELEPAGLISWGKADGFDVRHFGGVQPTPLGWMLVGALRPTPEATHLREVNAALVEAVQQFLRITDEPNGDDVCQMLEYGEAVEAMRAALARATTQEQAP
jgi:hypothetical protein